MEKFVSIKERRWFQATWDDIIARGGLATVVAAYGIEHGTLKNYSAVYKNWQTKDGPTVEARRTFGTEERALLLAQMDEIIATVCPL